MLFSPEVRRDNCFAIYMKAALFKTDRSFRSVSFVPEKLWKEALPLLYILILCSILMELVFFFSFDRFHDQNSGWVLSESVSDEAARLPANPTVKPKYGYSTISAQIIILKRSSHAFSTFVSLFGFTQTARRLFRFTLHVQYNYAQLYALAWQIYKMFKRNRDNLKDYESGNWQWPIIRKWNCFEPLVGGQQICDHQRNQL